MMSELTIFEIFQWMLRLRRTSCNLLLFFIMTSQLKHLKHYEFEFICVLRHMQRYFSHIPHLRLVELSFQCGGLSDVTNGSAIAWI